MPAVRTSKFLSLVLRHQPGLVGIELDAAGWVSVDTLLSALADHGHPVTRTELESVVRTSDKQRFAIDPVTDRIRANQGHSITVDLGLESAIPPNVLYHGTAVRTVDPILREGLDKRARHAVHLSPDVETAQRVGARRGEHQVLVIDAAAMQAAGYKFSLSANGVWLTDAVPPQYISRLAPTT